MFREKIKRKSDYIITLEEDVLVSAEFSDINEPIIVKIDFKNQNNNWISQIKSVGGIICFYDNLLIIQDYEGDLCIINYFDGKIINDFSLCNFKMLLPIHTKYLLNSKLCCYSGRIFNRKYGIFDIVTNEIQWENWNAEGFWMDNIFIINHPQNSIITHSYSGIFLWHFNLESLKITHFNQMHKYGEFQMKINHFVGVVHGILWIDVDVIMNGSFLLGLDAETGKCVHLLDIAENQNEVNYVALVPNRLPGSTFTTYDDKRNILFGFAQDHFHWQVDLSEKSPKIKMWSLEDEMKKQHAFVSAFMNCGISDSHVFFPVGSIGSTPQVFALNRDTLKVDWQYFLTEGGAYYTPTKVEVTETHLYVLDNTGTLNIFEKIEENEYSQA